MEAGTGSAEWLREEFSGVDLGDKRLNHRLMKTVERLAAGVAEASRQWSCPVVGGDVTSSDQVVVGAAGTGVLGQGVPAGGAELRVVAGSDVAVASPPSWTAPSTAPTSSAGTAAGGAATTTTTTPATPASGNPDYGYNAPSGAVPAYDPRSCPAG